MLPNRSHWLTATWKSAAGRGWTSSLRLRPDRRGTAVLSGTGGMRFLWSMHPGAHSQSDYPSLSPRWSRIGLAVVDNNHVLARATASLDLLSGGRMSLGLGAGFYWDAVQAIGGRRLTPLQGVTALGEAIDVIRGIWDAPNAEQAASDYLSAYGDDGGTPRVDGPARRGH